MKKSQKVIIITGPCGSGKTTICNMISKKLDIKLISGDNIKEEFFPEVNNIMEYPDKLKAVKEEILSRSKELFKEGNSLVIDYVILGESYIKIFKDEFKDSLVIKVLFPRKEAIHKRDKNRECWTTGEKCINEVYNKYLSLVDIIGKDNYINNDNETPKETFQKLKL